MPGAESNGIPANVSNAANRSRGQYCPLVTWDQAQFRLSDWRNDVNAEYPDDIDVPGRGVNVLCGPNIPLLIAA